MTVWVVRYRGFMQNISREFKTRERAEQWARQVGKFHECEIVQVRSERGKQW